MKKRVDPQTVLQRNPHGSYITDTMNSGSYVLNATKDKKERVGRILQMHANKRMELDKVYSGDIAAAIGFKFTTTGDTICDDFHYNKRTD